MPANGSMIKVSVPATSANCSIGFDSLGMALEWRAVFTFEPADELSVTGCDEEFANENNLVVKAFELAAKSAGKEVPPFHLHIESEIPLARGLGSSSACVVGGLAGANAWFDLGLTKEELLDLAIELEGHPDNAAPALMGDMTACFKIPENKKNPESDSGYVCSPIEVKNFCTLAVIPNYEVSTPEARKVLPEMIRLKDAASQTGRALVFRQAMESGDEKLLSLCCEDVYHEPYRSKLIPEYDYFSSKAMEEELPFWISGSGSTMLYLSSEPERLEKLKAEFEKKYPEFDCRILKPAKEGALAWRV